ncbi:uncharacterized protein LOC144288532 [Canis aureus]
MGLGATSVRLPLPQKSHPRKEAPAALHCRGGNPLSTRQLRLQRLRVAEKKAAPPPPFLTRLSARGSETWYGEFYQFRQMLGNHSLIFHRTTLSNLWPWNSFWSYPVIDVRIPKGDKISPSISGSLGPRVAAEDSHGDG